MSIADETGGYGEASGYGEADGYGEAGRAPASSARAGPRPVSPALRAAAAVLPAIIISYSALVDPLVNLDLARGQFFGGVAVESETKTRLARLVMPLVLLAAVGLALAARPSVPARLVRVAWPAAALLVMALLSAAWARAPSQTFTLAAYQVILFAALLICVAVARDPVRILRWVMAVFALVVAVNLVFVVTRPPTAIGHAGIYGFKNTLGGVGGCAFLFALFHVTDRSPLWRWLAWATVVGALAVTLASDSKTALALMIVAPLMAVGFFVCSKGLNLGPLTATLLLGALATSAVVTLATMAGLSADDILIATYGDTTFTGRTLIWGFALDYVDDALWIGNGYRSFWSIGPASPQHGSEIEFIRTIGSGHSGYVDMLLDLGIVGLTLLIVFALSAFLTASRLDLRPPRRSLLYVSVIVYVLGRNAMESVILWSSFFDNLSFLLVAFLAAYREPTARPR